MDWLEVSVATTAEAHEAVAERLMALGARGVVFGEADGAIVVTAYLPEEAEGRLEALAEEVRSLRSFGLDPGPGTVTVRRAREDDWAEAWKRYYRPVPVSERLIIVPAWEDPPEDGRIVIRLEPGMAFGTGTHPSTILALRAIEATLRPGEAAIDVGTGTGILAIAMAKLGAASVRAIDVDPVAVAVAEENVRQNGVADRVTVRAGDLFAGEAGPFDLLVANILPDVHERLVPEAVPRLRSGGRIVLSGIIEAEAERMARLLFAHGLIELKRLSADGWTALWAVRP